MTLLPYYKFFLVFYFLVGMHIVLPTPGGTGLYLSYNVIAWLIASLLIALGLWQITLNRKIYYSKMFNLLTLGCLLLIIPSFYAFEFTDHAIPRLLALLGGLLFLFTLYQFNLSKTDLLKLLALILVAVLIEACFGLVQFFFLEDGDWSGYKVGKSRPHGVFLQPNVMASFMATGLAIAMFLSSSKWLQDKPKPKNTLIITSLFITSFLLVLLQSRTGNIAAIAVILLTVPYFFIHAKKQLAINLITILLSVIIATISLNNSSTPLRKSEAYEEIGHRKAQFIISSDMIINQPMIGYGYGSFERAYIDHSNGYINQSSEFEKTVPYLSHPHNEVLFWVVEGGIVALLAFMLFTLAYLLSWRNLSLMKGILILALIFPLLLHCQLEFPFYSSVSHFIVFIIILFITDRFALNSDGKFKSIDIKKTFLIRFMAIFIPTIFIPFLATTLHTANILVAHQESKDKSIERFTEIVNPIAWQSRLDAAVYAHILLTGIKELDTNKLKSYLIWATNRIEHKPRVTLYQNCLLILKYLNQPQAYQLLLEDAKRTFPHQQSWKSDIIELPAKSKKSYQ